LAKGERKVQSNDSDDDDNSDSDDEFEAPSYDELVKLLNKYSRLIRKIKNENNELQIKNDSLSSKLIVAQKTSDELREEDKIVSSKLNEINNSNKEFRDEHNKLKKRHNELTNRYNLLKDEYTTLKINHDSLVVANELSSHEPHDATNHVVKIDIATSCDDLIVGSIEQGSSSKDKKVVESDNYDDYAKLKSENKKLKKDLEKATTTNIVVIENLDNDEELRMKTVENGQKRTYV
jgi:chromosome segregation ATPase